MKRTEASDGNKNDPKRSRPWYSQAMSRPESSTVSSSQHTDSQQQNQPEPEQNAASLSAAQTPSTTAQTFPSYGYTMEPNHIFNTMEPNPFMMPYNMYQANCPFPDNRMYSATVPENNVPSVNYSVPSSRNIEVASSTTAGTKEQEPQQSNGQAEAQPKDYFGAKTTRQPSPSSSSDIPLFTEEEAKNVDQMLREESSFKTGLNILTNWLDKGVCTKTNCSEFFTLLQSAHHVIWKLMNKKSKLKEDLNEIKIELSRKVSGISAQFEEICKVFEVAKLQKVWDQFTKPQRKQISSWKDDAGQFMKILSEELAEDDVENHDSRNDSPDSSMDCQKEAAREEYQKLQEELDNLRNQLKAAQEENAALKSEEQAKSNTYQNAVSSLVEQCHNYDSELVKLRKFKSDAESSPSASEKNPIQPSLNREPLSTSNNISDKVVFDANNMKITSDEVHLITLIGTFLNVHPFGASVDYICSYLTKINSKITDSRYVESLLRRLPQVFKEETDGIGATLVRNWYFLGFDEIAK